MPPDEEGSPGEEAGGGGAGRPAEQPAEAFRWWTGLNVPSAGGLVYRRDWQTFAAQPGGYVTVPWYVPSNIGGGLGEYGLQLPPSLWPYLQGTVRPVPGRGGGSGRGRSRIIPGFLDRLLGLQSGGFDLRDPGIMLLVPRADAVAFCLGHDVERAGAERIAAGGADTYAEQIEKGWLQSVATFLSDLVPHRDEPEPRIVLHVPLAELHCPHLADCEAAYTRSVEREKKFGLDLTLRGNKAGGGISTQVVVREKMLTRGNCVRITTAALISTMQYSHRLSPDVQLEVVRVEKLQGVFGNDDVPAAGHLCGPNYAEMMRVFEAKASRGEHRGDWYRWHPLKAKSFTGAVLGERETTRSRSFRFTHAGVEVESRFTRGVFNFYNFADQRVDGYFGYYPGPDAELFYWSW